MKIENFLSDIKIKNKVGYAPVNNLMRFLKRSSSEEIVSYFNEATRMNINIMNTFLDMEALQLSYKDYHQIIFKWLKENNFSVIEALKNNGYNCFNMPELHNKESYTPALDYTFFGYFKYYKNTLSSFKEKEKYVNFFAHSLNQLDFETIRKYEDVLNTPYLTEKKRIYLFEEQAILNLPVINNNALRLFQIIGGMNVQEIGKRLKEFKKDKENHKYLSEIYQNLFIQRKSRTLISMLNNIFVDVNEFNHNFLTPYLYNIKGLKDDIGYELLQLKEDGIDIKVDDYPVKKQNLPLINAICRSEQREMNLSILKNIGVKINAIDVQNSLFSINTSRSAPMDITEIFEAGKPEKQSQLLKEAFINVLNDNNQYESLHEGLNIIDYEKLTTTDLSEIMRATCEVLRERKRKIISDSGEKDNVIIVVKKLLDKISTRYDFMNVLTSNHMNNVLFYGICHYYEFSQSIVEQIRQKNNDFFGHYINSLYVGKYPTLALYQNYKNIFTSDLYHICFEDDSLDEEELNMRQKDICYLFLRLLKKRLDLNVSLSQEEDNSIYLCSETEKAFFEFINKDTQYTNILLNVLKDSYDKDSRYQIYCEKELLKVQKNLINSQPKQKQQRL